MGVGRKGLIRRSGSAEALEEETIQELFIILEYTIILDG
jgi:hypothetical protein